MGKYSILPYIEKNEAYLCKHYRCYYRVKSQNSNDFGNSIIHIAWGMKKISYIQFSLQYTALISEAVGLNFHINWHISKIFQFGYVQCASSNFDNFSNVYYDSNNTKIYFDIWSFFYSLTMYFACSVVSRAHSPSFAKFWRRCVLSGGTQRFAWTPE